MTFFEKMVQFMKQPWVILFYSLLLVGIFVFVDKPLAFYIHHLNLRANLPLKIVTLFGSKYLYLPLFFLLALYFRFLKKNSVYEARSWYLFFTVLAGYLICCLLKVILGRARPELLFSMNLYGFYWFKLSTLYLSMPSGHSFVSVAVASGLGLFLPRFFPLFLSLAGFVMLSRVFLYYHYLSDVLLAFYLSILFVAVWTPFLKKTPFFNKGFSRA